MATTDVIAEIETWPEAKRLEYLKRLKALNNPVAPVDNTAELKTERQVVLNYFHYV